MSTYSVRLGGIASTTASQNLLFTADAAAVYVIRDIAAYNGAGSGDLRVTVSVVSGSQTFGIMSTPTIAPTDSFHWEGRQVLHTGDQLYAFGSGSNWSVVVSGYALSP